MGSAGGAAFVFELSDDAVVRLVVGTDETWGAVVEPTLIGGVSERGLAVPVGLAAAVGVVCSNAALVVWAGASTRAETFKGVLDCVCGLEDPRLESSQNNRSASRATSASETGSITPTPCRTVWAGGSIGRKCGDGGLAGGVSCCACLARLKASLIKLIR